MDIKDDLKNIVREHLANVASSIFIDRSLAIMDESADTKESLLAAVDRVSKRIALFIDTDLATKVIDILRRKIENRKLTPGIKRKHVRVFYRNRVCITHNGTASELYTENLSEGGMYITSKEPFPAGSKLEITLPLQVGNRVHLKGIVVNTNRNIGKNPPGMGIEFKEVRDDQRMILRNFLKNAAARDLLQAGERPR